MVTPEPPPPPPPTPPAPPTPAPTTPPGIINTTLTYEGVPINVQLLQAPNRQYDQTDVKKGITNREPYRAQIVDQVVSVQVTDALKNKVAGNARGALSTQINNQINKFFAAANVKTDVEISAVVAQNQYYYDQLFDKYKALFDNGDAVKAYLTDYGLALYPSIKSKYEQAMAKAKQKYQQANDAMEAWYKKSYNYTQSDEGQAAYRVLERAKNAALAEQDAARNLKYIKLLENLNFNKFKPAGQVDQDLEKGLTIDPDDSNVYVNADGTLDSNTRTPLTNNTTAVLSRDNGEKRAFGISGYYGRGGDSIATGDWPGWNKTDVTSQYARYDSNINAANGISVDQYTKQASNTAKTARDQGVVVTVDVANSGGYAHIRGVINNLKAQHVDITGYRLLNVGLNDNNQKIDDIIAALPDHLPLLEVWVESPTGDTSGLNPLETKKIDELSIYTHNNALRSSWSIDPWALKGVAWVNTIDYNVSSEYAPGLKVPSRVTFNYLSFADSDYKGNGDYSRINDGLRMAYWVRNNEKVFQGYFGPGLNPDKDEQGNSYIMGLDLSHVTHTRSLRGLVFSDTLHPERPPRKLKYIKLYSDGQSFNISADELNNAQFSTVLDTTQPQQPRSNISFSNGNTTRTVTVTGAGLTYEGIRNLQTLLQWSDNFSLNGLSTKIHAINSSTANYLRSNGFNVDNGPLLIGS